MNLFLFLLFLGFSWLGVIKYTCTLEENKKEKERKEDDEMLKNIKGIYEKFNLQNRNWITECVTIYSNRKSHEITHPLSDKVEFKLKNGKLYVAEIIKNVSHYNGEEIVTYFNNATYCLNEIFEKGIIVGFEIADWNFAGRPAEIRIAFKDKHYYPFLEWNITENYG